MWYSASRRVLFCLEPERAHNLVLNLLRLSTKIIPNHLSHPPFQKPTKALGLTFPNPIGLAAGLDKNGVCVEAFSRLGFGFVEVGTLTPRPQLGNPKPRLFRLTKNQALINRMGFNNKGIDYFLRVIKTQKYHCKLGINIGKNKDTSNEDAYKDYLYCYQKAYPFADYIVVNISSPNTPGLRELQTSHYLKNLLDPLCEAREKMAPLIGRHVPLVVKVAPDLTAAEMIDFADTLNQFPVQGVIATNTTITRPGLEAEPLAEEAGGLSGSPLAPLALNALRTLAQSLRSDIDLISVGGIDSKQVAQERFNEGANLIQLYTSLIYQGPTLVRHLLSS